MLARILVVEDNDDQAELIQFQLEQAGYGVCLAANGSAGIRLAYEYQPDLILLDVMLPEMSGWSVCERLRQITDIPIIFLTVLDQEKNIVQGLKLGGDDYLTKPYDCRELAARIEAVLRRHALQAPPPAGIYVYGDLEIDFDRRRVIRGDRTVSLTPLEFRLLACLAEKPGKSYSHHYLLRRVWKHTHSSRNSLKLYICYLRQKIELDSKDPKIVLTDHGVGYHLCHPEQIR